MILTLILAASAPCIIGTYKQVYGVTYACLRHDAIWSVATPIEPHFQRSPKGWLPTCPAGMDLVRHNPKPDCLWGTAPMNSKPTQGDFECVPVAQVPKAKCPVE